MKVFSKRIPLPGLRNIKTALSILILLVFYNVTGRENYLIAISAAILCLQDSVSKSLEEGWNRVITAIVGGVYGLLFLLLGLNNDYFLNAIGISVSTILIIYICNLLKEPDYILNCLFSFIFVVLVPLGDISPFSYAFNRTVDNIIGIVIALLINRYFFPPKVQRVAYKRTQGTIEQLKKDSNYVSLENCKKTTWAGGEALELLIYPKNSLYEELDFKYRISVAESKGELDLSVLPNYYRRTMILEGETVFVHEGYHTVNLKKFDQDYFKGNIKTTSKGTTKNFNIMFRKGVESEISTIANQDHFDLLTITNNNLGVFEVALFYSLFDGNIFTISKDGLVIYTASLDKGDCLAFKNLDHYRLDELIVCVNNSEREGSEEVICIRANINN